MKVVDQTAWPVVWKSGGCIWNRMAYIFCRPDTYRVRVTTTLK